MYRQHFIWLQASYVQQPNDMKLSWSSRPWLWLCVTDRLQSLLPSHRRVGVKQVLQKKKLFLLVTTVKLMNLHKDHRFLFTNTNATQRAHTQPWTFLLTTKLLCCWYFASFAKNKLKKKINKNKTTKNRATFVPHWNKTSPAVYKNCEDFVHKDQKPHLQLCMNIKVTDDLCVLTASDIYGKGKRISHKAKNKNKNK